MKGDIKLLNRILALGFISFSLAFLLSLEHRPYALSWVVKTIPISLLAFGAFKSGKRSGSANSAG